MDLRAILAILGPLSMMAVSCKQPAHAPLEQPRRAPLQQNTLSDESGAPRGTPNRTGRLPRRLATGGHVDIWGHVARVNDRRASLVIGLRRA